MLYYNYYTTGIKHASCKLKLARKPITTAIKLATTLQDLQSLAKLLQAHLYMCVLAQKYSNEQFVAAIHRIVYRARDF